MWRDPTPHHLSSHSTSVFWVFLRWPSLSFVVIGVVGDGFACSGCLLLVASCFRSEFVWIFCSFRDLKLLSSKPVVLAHSSAVDGSSVLVFLCCCFCLSVRICCSVCIVLFFVFCFCGCWSEIEGHGNSCDLFWWLLWFRLFLLNPKGSGSINPKGFVLVKTGDIGTLVLDSLIVSGLLRSAGIKATGLPPLSGFLIRLSLWLISDCYARKSF